MNEREAFIQERLRAEFARWMKWAMLAGAIIFPALTALDVVVYPAQAARFFVYRIAVAACLVLTAFIAGRVRDHRAHFLLGLLAVGVSAATIEAMILRTGGHVSPYATGMILLVVCVLAYIPGSMLFHGLAACSIIGIYALPIIAAEPIRDFRTFFLTVFFLSSIILAMMALRYLALRSFREQASALYEVRAYGDALPHAGEEADADPIAAVRRLREEIAARRSTEKMLEASEKKYRTLFESAPDAFYIIDLAGTFIDGNRKAEEMTGYRRDEAIGRNFLSLNLFPLSLVPRAMKLLALNALGHATGPDEFGLKAKGGHVTPVEISTYPVTIDGKRVVLGIARDITERRRSEERLRSLSRRLEFLVSSSPAIIYTCRYGGDWAATFVSDNLKNVLGYDATTFLESPGFWAEGIHPDDRERVLAGLSALGETDSHQHEYRFRHKDGSFRWMLDRVQVVRNETGDPVECVGSWVDIDARKRAEEALRESEARFRSIAETSMDVIYRIDQNGTVIYVSPSVLPVLGFAEKETTGRHFLRFVHDEDQGKAQEAFATLLQGRPVKSLDLRVLKKTGGFIHSEINVSPILDKNNGVMEIQGVIHNITERKSAEEEVKRINQNLERIVAERTVQLEEANRVLRLEVDARRRSEESLLLIKDCLESLPLGVSIVDTAGRIMYVNPADAEMHGHAREDLVGRDIGVYAAPEARKAMSFEELSSRGPWKRESINVRKDGKAFPVHLMSRAVCNREGEPFGIITACEDITERKRAEEALREGERKHRELATQLKTVLDAIPDVMMLLTPDLQVQWINRAADKEDRPLSLQKVLCCDVLGTCEKKEAACFAAETLRTGAKHERRHVFPDGRIAEIRTFPVRDEAGGLSHILVSLTDATEKVRMQEETERSRRLAALGELAAGVAHEINNPITSIINYGQLLADDGAPGSAFAEYGGRIIRDGERVAEIVKSMLSFARQQPAERTRCGVQRILHEAGLMVESQLKKEGIVLHIDLDPGLPDIEAAVQQLLQVLFNLISNARHALNEKQHEPGRAKLISIRGEAVDEAGRTLVRLRVRDNGTGIPRSKLGMVFQPFFTTKPVGKGTGLGLSVCHGIIEAHGGTLKIESEESQYTEAIIDLPAGRFESDGRTA